MEVVIFMGVFVNDWSYYYIRNYIYNGLFIKPI